MYINTSACFTAQMDHNCTYVNNKSGNLLPVVLRTDFEMKFRSILSRDEFIPY